MSNEWSGKVVFTVDLNTNIEDNMKHALKAAALYGEPVKFNLCGVDMVVSPSDTMQDLGKRFFAEWVPLAKKIREISAILDNGVINPLRTKAAVAFSVGALAAINERFNPDVAVH